jgi:hypothetical protein
MMASLVKTYANNYESKSILLPFRQVLPSGWSFLKYLSFKYGDYMYILVLKNNLIKIIYLLTFYTYYNEK